MTKVELIRKVAKNVGIPDADAKIFFELFLKRISTIVEIGQSIFVKDFGYFHLIKGSIKKPVVSSKENEVSEEDVELILFSESKDLRKSDTKGLVFNIPVFDEEDYHPIDSTFSLSIGKPLIPLRGVPFDDVFIPTSGYEYRRLIESKVEKIITESDIAESVENFPTLVIDARSYNSNQVQLQWEDKDYVELNNKSEAIDKTETEIKTELSEYEKQTKELKNIAWDFGEDLSKQIEAESILDIADERINLNLNQPEKIEKSETAEEELTEFVEDINADDTSDKLNELLEGQNETNNIFEEEIIEHDILDKFEPVIEGHPDELLNEHIEEQTDEQLYDPVNELNSKSIDEIVADQFADADTDEAESEEIDNLILDAPTDKDFWKSTSKYFEPYNPGSDEDTSKEFQDARSENQEELSNNNIELDLSSEKGTEHQFEDENEEEVVLDSNQNDDETIPEIPNESQEVKMEEDTQEDKTKFEKSVEQNAVYFESAKKKNLIPFILFPLLVIGLSLALYWYLEYYKKNDVVPITKQIVLKTENAKIVQRDFDIPVTYPYLPKINETTISEDLTPIIEEPVVQKNGTADKIIEEKKTELKPETKSEIKTEVKENKKSPVVENKTPVQNTARTGTGLNVGNNIFKYGNYFVVQVASFRASSISENEASKYRNKGFNAFVEEAEIPNRGIWYRVRVGNFSTKEEAQSFANKNIR